MTYESDIDMI
jgi:hypothetical protein